MKYSVFFLSLIFFSCSQPEEQVPADVLAEGKFIEVLKDKALVEAAMNVNVNNVGGEKFDSVYNFNVYVENGITKAQYDSTMKFYSAKPEDLKVIMDSVLLRLNIEKAKR
jgi:hypothetical protein